MTSTKSWPPTKEMNTKVAKVAVAPMLDVTTQHFRYMMRLITKQATLYTEMYSDQAMARRSPEELGVGLVDANSVAQLGGSDPVQIAVAAKKLANTGFREINLNVGCPSHKVQEGRFGCILMKSPDVVANLAEIVASATGLPTTVKCRLGVDDLDSEEFLHTFIERITRSGTVQHVIVHARKAWLSGLSPKENRTIPPIDWDRVHRLKKAFPHLAITINGNIQTLEEMHYHLGFVEGVMVGRQAERDPFMFATVDRDFFGSSEPIPTREKVVSDYLNYVVAQVKNTTFQEKLKISFLLKPLFRLYHAQQNGKAFRRYLSGSYVDHSNILSVVDGLRDLLATEQT